jgi:hypothetical protein
MIHVSLERRGGRPVVVHRADKSGDGDRFSDVDRLRTVHDVLVPLAGIGVPEVLGWHDEGRHAELVLAFLPACRRLSRRELAGAARILAGAHERGLVHGGFTAGSVCVDPDGRVVVDGWVGTGTAADDVAAVGAVLAAMPRRAGGEGRHDDLGGLTARATAADPALRPGMGALADGLYVPPPRSERSDLAPAGRAVHGPRRPVVETPGGAQLRARRSPWAAVAGGLSVLGLMGISALLPVRSAESSALPAGPRVTIDGITWAVGEPGDHAAVGDWDCDGHPSPALLRADGSVWIWDRPDVAPTADGTNLAARSIGVAQGRGGCDRLVLRDAAGQELPVSRWEDPAASPPRSPAGAPAG